MDELPPGVVVERGKLYRFVTKTSADGTEWQQRRLVTLDQKEARRIRADYYHPTLRQWVLEGYKLTQDRTPSDIMAEVPVTVPPDNTESQEQEGETQSES